jgi:hypothetical protein
MSDGENSVATAVEGRAVDFGSDDNDDGGKIDDKI